MNTRTLSTSATAATDGSSQRGECEKGLPPLDGHHDGARHDVADSLACERPVRHIEMSPEV